MITEKEGSTSLSKAVSFREIPETLLPSHEPLKWREVRGARISQLDFWNFIFFYGKCMDERYVASRFAFNTDRIHRWECDMNDDDNR